MKFDMLLSLRNVFLNPYFFNKVPSPFLLVGFICVVKLHPVFPRSIFATVSWSWCGPGWRCWSGGRGRAWRWAVTSRWNSRVGVKYRCSLCSLFVGLSSEPSGLGRPSLSHQSRTEEAEREY